MTKLKKQEIPPSMSDTTLIFCRPYFKNDIFHVILCQYINITYSHSKHLYAYFYVIKITWSPRLGFPGKRL